MNKAKHIQLSIANSWQFKFKVKYGLEHTSDCTKYGSVNEDVCQFWNFTSNES